MIAFYLPLWLRYVVEEHGLWVGHEEFRIDPVGRIVMDGPFSNRTNGVGDNPFRKFGFENLSESWLLHRFSPLSLLVVAMLGARMDSPRHVLRGPPVPRVGRAVSAAGWIRPHG